MSMTKDELRKELVEVKAMRKGMPVGDTEADYKWQKRIEAVHNLFLNWLEYELGGR